MWGGVQRDAYSKVSVLHLDRGVGVHAKVLFHLLSRLLVDFGLALLELILCEGVKMGWVVYQYVPVGGGSLEDEIETCSIPFWGGRRMCGVAYA